MDKKELLKAIMELPKIETNNLISSMNGINVDDLMSAIDRLNKVPDYNDLLKKPTTELALQIMELSSENLILEQQCKKQKEIINKATEYIQKIFYFNEETGEYSLLHTFDKCNAKELLDILKEVSK